MISGSPTLTSPSPHKMGLGGVEIALPATLNFFYNCVFLQLCILSGSPTPSPHKMGLGGVEIVLPATLNFFTTVFFATLHFFLISYS